MKKVVMLAVLSSLSALASPSLAVAQDREHLAVALECAKPEDRSGGYSVYFSGWDRKGTGVIARSVGGSVRRTKIRAAWNDENGSVVHFYSAKTGASIGFFTSTPKGNFLALGTEKPMPCEYVPVGE